MPNHPIHELPARLDNAEHQIAYLTAVIREQAREIESVSDHLRGCSLDGPAIHLHVIAEALREAAGAEHSA